MTARSLDIGALGRRAGYILFTDGPEQPAATARETCILLDMVADAEYRAGKAEERIEAAQEKAWEECAAMAAHHGAFDGSRARWLSSINPYNIIEKEKEA